MKKVSLKIVLAALTALIGVLLMSALLGLRWWQHVLEQPLTKNEPEIILTVQSGDGLGTVLRQLSASGHVKYPRLTRLWAKWTELDRGLQVGEYRLDRKTNLKQLLQMLNKGQVIRYGVTLPEGITLAQALAILHATPELSVSIDGVGDPKLAELTEYPGHPEGWFLPETYFFVRGDSDADILARANLLMREALNDAWQSRDDGLPLANPYEVLILASIVERETSVPAERESIAGVFVRRLKKGMRLQTDPSVIYGLGENYKGNLRRSHLRDDKNPWNTYRIPGLPPTPIALPGKEALNATVHPGQGRDLYFVAKGDGYHAFAETLEAHQSNVQRYQLQRRADYRSTPVK